MHFSVFLIRSASFYPSGLSLCLSVDQFCLVPVDDMVLFHGMVCDGWIVSYTVLPCRGGWGLCTSCERVHFFLVFLDPQTELSACLFNIWAGAVLARHTIDQFGLLLILDLVLRLISMPVCTIASRRRNVSQKSMSARYLVNCLTNFNQTWHANNTENAHFVATTQIQKFKGHGYMRLRCIRSRGGGITIHHFWSTSFSTRCPKKMRLA